MDIQTSIEKLKSEIRDVYNSTRKDITDNILRGHSRSISSDVEDKIALFIASLLPNDYKFFIDSSLRANGKTHRPDLLVIDNKDNVIALIEIKTNMGWCRNAAEVIDKIKNNHEIFLENKTITCKFSNDNTYKVKYADNVKLFLIALTTGNCSEQNHINNKKYAKKVNVYQYNLFEGWYDTLKSYEIKDFANELVKLNIA